MVGQSTVIRRVAAGIGAGVSPGDRPAVQAMEDGAVDGIIAEVLAGCGSRGVDGLWGVACLFGKRELLVGWVWEFGGFRWWKYTVLADEGPSADVIGGGAVCGRDAGDGGHEGGDDGGDSDHFGCLGWVGWLVGMWLSWGNG